MENRLKNLIYILALACSFGSAHIINAYTYTVTNNLTVPATIQFGLDAFFKTLYSPSPAITIPSGATVPYSTGNGLCLSQVILQVGEKTWKLIGPYDRNHLDKEYETCFDQELEIVSEKDGTIHAYYKK
jgi:hypothetical protein